MDPSSRALAATTTAALKVPASAAVNPSPKSVMVNHNNNLNSLSSSFEDEPFDCASKPRTKSAQTLTPMQPSCIDFTSRSTGAANSNGGTHTMPKRSFIPMQSPRRMALPRSTPQCTPTAPTVNVSPSKSQRASSFRLRRMQLTQQRKWKEEYIERTVQSKTMFAKDSYTDDEEEDDNDRSYRSYRSCRSRKSDSRLRSRSSHLRRERNGIGTMGMAIGSKFSTGIAAGTGVRTGPGSDTGIPIGKELLISNAEGMEISISSHLQKAGFNSSLIPSADRYDRDLPCDTIHANGYGNGHGSTYNDANDHVGVYKGNEQYENEEESFNDDRSFAMDTVSSLNSTLYASDDGMSLNKGFKIKSLSQASVGSKRGGGGDGGMTSKNAHMPKVNMIATDGNHNNNTNNEDSLHPPLYVSSVKKVRRKKKKKQITITADESDGPDGGDNDDSDGDLNDPPSNTLASFLSDEEDYKGDIPMVTLTSKDTDTCTLGSLTNDDTFDDDIVVERKLLGRNSMSTTPGSQLKNTSVMSPFNSSVNKSVNPLDKTELVSNKERSDNKLDRPPIMKPQSVEEKENDIPWHKSKYRSIESRKADIRDVSRERPINPQMLNIGGGEGSKSPQDEPPSLSSARSPTTLRRRRLQLYLSSSDGVSENENGSEAKEHSPPISNNANASKSSLQYSPDDDEGDIVKGQGKKDMQRQIDFNAAESSFDTNSQVQDNNLKVDTLSVKSGRSCRSGRSVESSVLSLKSGKSIISGKSGRSAKSIMSQQTYATLKSCVTIKPDSPEEMERIVKRKQRQLYLLHHALSCTHPHATDPEDENYVPCKEVKSCQALCTLVKHVQTCTFTDRNNGSNGQVCPVPGCKEYKKVWNHYRRCVLRTFTGKDTKKCRLCGNIWGSTIEENHDEEASI